MVKEIIIRVSPRVAADNEELLKVISNHDEVKHQKINDWKIIKKSVDARQKDVKIQLRIIVATDEDMSSLPDFESIEYRHVTQDSIPIVIVGAGPAGLFAALKALQYGLKPIVVERGKDVDSRRFDLAEINRNKQINPESNYCFGEGGAGTFSDGKLYTRSKKRGDIMEVLRILVQHGASPEILIDHHPHIGSDRLPHVIKSIRETIIEHGGEVHFDTCMDEIIIDNNVATGIKTTDGMEYHGAVVLAIGHSARDTVKKLHQQNIYMESKGIAVGVRVEHPQLLIDRLQYHNKEGRGSYLPAAEYNFVVQVDGRGVYSFCMCPGGVIVPAASGSEENVVNGMSASSRAGRWANAAFVVEIHPEDFPEYNKYGAMSLLKFQEDLERKFYDAAGATVMAPAQRMTDFLESKKSSTLEKTSYIPGLISYKMDELLPAYISDRLKKGFRQIDKRCRGFVSSQAQLIGLESRTSSPVRLVRNRETFCHIGVKNLYPAGEGAGYAGGIVSAAMDGQNCVKAYFDTL